MDGWKTAKRIRDLPSGKHCAMIALTGFGQTEHKRKSEDVGFDCHLVKPVDLDVLETLLLAIHQRAEANASR